MPVEAPTQAPSQFDRHRERTRRLIAVLLAAGIVLFWFGVSASGVFLPTGAEAAELASQHLLAAGALLLVCVTALVTLWHGRQEAPRPLPRVAMLLVGIVAPTLAVGILAAGHWVQTGDVSGSALRLGWLFAGLLALGLQLYLGALDPDVYYDRVVGAEVLCVSTFVLAGLVVGLGPDGSPAFLTLAPLVAVLLLLFPVFGGTLYLLGYLLVRRPRYYRIG